MFSVKESLPNVTPAQLMAYSDGREKHPIVYAVLVNTHIRPLQKVSDDLFVIDRRTEDNARTSIWARSLRYGRCTYYSVAETLAMKTINLPLAKKLLRDD
ncbi:unnamed protein product [Peronospora destructor]|uniref:Uncharacterized protein n=1 Tax=Peronospora destructor TaxID=86335 RepID=A0AAV0TAJ0_9STRA|nr:unnamed protein product [Peronospora destructor]